MFTKLAKMLSASRRKEEGFTLIELLIVVAIIAILAAIAIPQFSAYRVRGFNAAANSDVRNAKTSEEALFADFQTYGKTENQTSLAGATATTGVGTLLLGPLPAATATVVASGSGLLSGPRSSDGLAVAVGVALSNGVNMASVSAAPVAPTLSSVSYILATKHTQGDREFAAETESTSLMYCQNGTWAGTALAAGGGPATFAAAATTAVDITGACGGTAPIVNWSAL